MGNIFGWSNADDVDSLTEEEMRSRSANDLKMMIKGLGLDSSGCVTKNDLAHLAWMGEYDDRTRPVGSSDPVPSMMPQEAKTEVQEAQNPVAFGETGLTTEMLDFSIQIPSDMDKAEAAQFRTLHMIKAQCCKLEKKMEATKMDDEMWAEAIDLLDLVANAATSAPDALVSIYGDFTVLDKSLRRLAEEVRAMVDDGKENAEFRRVLAKDLKIATATSALHSHCITL